MKGTCVLVLGNRPRKHGTGGYQGLYVLQNYWKKKSIILVWVYCVVIY